MRRVPGWLLVAVCCFGLACGPSRRPQQFPSMVARPAETAEVQGLAAVAAAQPCANWAWAAAVETLLAAQRVRLDQKHWVLKANGGEVCLPRAGSPEQLARFIDGDYALDDGRKIRLRARWHTTISPDDLVAAARAGRPVIVFWRDYPYLLYGITFQEFVASTGHRLFDVAELKLLDLAAGGAARALTWERGRDRVADIGGAMDIEVADRVW